MVEVLRLLDFGCVPEAAVPTPILIQSELSTTLIFDAQQLSGDRYINAGRAVVRFEGCVITKFGYPNDEAWGAIPRTRGFAYDFFEVDGSSWAVEIAALNRYAFPEFELDSARHFLILFHESSFECLAQNVSVELSNKPRPAILCDITNRIAEE